MKNTGIRGLLFLLLACFLFAAPGCARQEKTPSARILHTEAREVSSYIRKSGMAEKRREESASYRTYYCAEVFASGRDGQDLTVRAEDFCLTATGKKYSGVSFVSDEKEEVAEEMEDRVLLRYTLQEEDTALLAVSETRRLLVSFALPQGLGADDVYSLTWCGNEIPLLTDTEAGAASLFQAATTAGKQPSLIALPAGEVTVYFAPLDETEVYATYHAVAVQLEIAEKERLFSASEFILTAGGAEYRGKYFLECKNAEGTATVYGKSLKTEAAMVSRIAGMTLTGSQTVTLIIAFDAESIPGDFSIRFTDGAE